jgi:hypothetical protein
MSNTIKIKQIDQTQLAAFVNDILDGTGAVYTANRALVTDGAGDVTTSSVTATELGYLSGVTSAIQTQFNNLGSTYLALAGGTMTGPLTLDAASLLKFGGSTSSYPALKRSSTELQVRLADDSGYAPLGIGLTLTFAGGPSIFFNGSELTSTVRFQSLGGVSSESHLSIGPYPNYTYLYADAVDVFAQRRSTNAQTFRVYGTASGSPGSDYVRASLSCSATAVTLAAESGGTGASNVNINITPAGTGGVAIGSGGSAISKVLSATASLNFDLTALTVEDKTMTVTGAAVGDIVTLGVPNGSVTTSVQYTAWVSAADTVTVRARTSATGEDPASGTFRATVIKH